MQKKIMRSKVEARVLEAAIEAFAESGFEGTSARDIAKELGTTTMPLYHSFKNKEYLFRETLNEVIACSFDPSHLLLCFYEDQKPKNLHSLLLSALHRWYRVLPRSDARILMFARLSQNKDWRATAVAAIQGLINTLTTTIGREIAKKPRQKLPADTNVAAQGIILILLQLKTTSAQSASPREAKEEASNVQVLLEYMVNGLGPALSD
jgi:AcrR family transcriptional regulator